MELIGQVNEYRCRECGHILHTINLSNGTTPFTIGCPGCKGDYMGGAYMTSGFYRCTKQPIITQAFFRPAKLPGEIAIAEFVKNGALLNKPLLEACAEVMHDDPTMPDMDLPQWVELIALKWEIPIWEV